MHWILQNNLFNEAAYQVLLDTLIRFQIPHSIHKVIPFVGELVDPPELDQKNVICMGSYSLRHVAKKNGWNPGVFDLEPFDFTKQLEHWGINMLNYDSIVSSFEDVKLTDELTFIRPIHDSKVFAGTVFDKKNFEDWQHKVCVLEEDYGDSLTKNTLVQICNPKQIYNENRFWIVKGRIVCASLYKRGKKVIYSDEVPKCYFDFIIKMISIWQPHDAFVIDMCDTPEGLKIVEINTLNSSGFYAANIPKLVTSLEENFG